MLTAGSQLAFKVKVVLVLDLEAVVDHVRDSLLHVEEMLDLLYFGQSSLQLVNELLLKLEAENIVIPWGERNRLYAILRELSAEFCVSSL